MDAELLHITASSPEPIYRQIAEQVRRLVSAGHLRPGDTLPSVRDVAAAHAINPMTVSRAYSQLEADGVLHRLRGKGMTVAARPELPSEDERLQLLEPRLAELARHSRELELPARQVLRRLQQLLDTNR